LLWKIHFNDGEERKWEDEEWKQFLQKEKQVSQGQDFRQDFCSEACKIKGKGTEYVLGASFHPIPRHPHGQGLCIKCRRNKVGTNTENLCPECFEKDKPTQDPNKRKPKPGECCENCGASSIINKTKTTYTWKRIRYTVHKTDFTRSYTCWFGFNCPCAENYRRNNQQTCPQCKKHEFPDMSKGWMLDYEIKMAFCSPKCHVDYRELKWEEAEKLTKIEMFPPALDVEVNPNSKVDWEKEGLKQEVLFLRELVKELEKKLSKPDNLTPEEKQQANYLKKLQQNTLNSAEDAYKNKYGILSEDGSEKGKGLSGGVIALIVVGVVALVGGIIFLLTRNKKKIK
jgi:hypothetical protein